LFARTQGLIRSLPPVALVAAAVLAIWAAVAPPAHSYTFGPTVQSGGAVADIWDPATSACVDPPWQFPVAEDPEPEAPDLPTRAYRDQSGTAWLVMPRADKNRRVRLSNLAEDCNLALSHRDTGGGGSNANYSSFEWNEWVAAPFVLPSGQIASLVYNEYLGFNFPNTPQTGHCTVPVGADPFSYCWGRAISFAVSNDGGASFVHPSAPPAHRVANIPYAYEQHPSWGANGYLAPTNIVRRMVGSTLYYYSIINVLTAPQNGFDNKQLGGICVMRTSDLLDPASWRGYGDGDGDGDYDFDVQFSYPYPEPADPERHVCKSLTHVGNPPGPERADLKADFVARSLTFNTHFGQYLLIGFTGATVWYSLSSDLLDWSPRQELMTAPTLAQINADPSPDCNTADTPIAHPSVIDPSDTSPSFEYSDQTVDLYFTKRKLATNQNGKCFVSGNELARTTVSFVPYPRYPRPGFASPLRVPLVPAYRQCSTGENATHAPPLDMPACAPPVRESSLLTLGTAGAGSAFAKLTVVGGDPGTTADEADLGIDVFASDVRRASDNGDYTGQLALVTRMRMTDQANGPAGQHPAVVQDSRFGVPISCVDNGASGGATCSATTSADTLVPGFAKEGQRAIVSALAVDLLDPGADGSFTPASGACPPTCGSGDEKVFLMQGIFTP
jgi:hypothetical protein